MNREIYLKLIADALGTLSHQVEYRNSISLYDINIVSEDFFKEFLNLIYGHRLVNLNIIEKNIAAIDLGDIEEKIAIQVTSDNSSTKIRETITKFIDKKLYEKYDRLVILIITRKKSYTSQFETRGTFSFNKENDILDSKDILLEIKEKSTEELMHISKFLQEELVVHVHKVKKKQANEIETIIELIEYLSNNKGKIKRRLESPTDPKHKINKRFNEYAEFLKGLYVELVSLYGDAVEQAITILGLDEVKSLIMGLFLRDISNKFLEEANGNPKIALENLALYFEKLLGESGKEYDLMAIKFFLINETINCNVFPNAEGQDEPISI
ncbi:SMEK domain-containing protein [Sporosarcina luteola]|uniref:SMEK domain-containing protein n=1 Tax=Sporosarcina luteola TaxID=582850 RepID=UPI00203A3F8D|nr:SMEK domain-containing protein [Sporosarcina luteola]MCM3638249.1 SMEK domain-containing protein [Sporosarcina luteola]